MQTSLSLLSRDMGEDGPSEHRKKCWVNVRNHCNNAWVGIKIWELVTEGYNDKSSSMSTDNTKDTSATPVLHYRLRPWRLSHSLLMPVLCNWSWYPRVHQQLFFNATPQTIKVADNEKLQDSLTEQFKGRAYEELLLSKGLLLWHSFAEQEKSCTPHQRSGWEMLLGNCRIFCCCKTFAYASPKGWQVLKLHFTNSFLLWHINTGKRGHKILKSFLVLNRARGQTFSCSSWTCLDFFLCIFFFLKK